MRRLNYLHYTVLIILIPIVIVILSSNLVLRFQETYVFHFNDSQVVNKLYTDITPTEFADEIASYWSSFSKNEFQIYEENAIFKDELFGKKEVQVMGLMKKIVNIQLLTGLLFSIIIFFIYRRIYMNKHHAALHRLGYISGAITLAVVVLVNILLRIGAVRSGLYNLLIGVELSKKCALVTLLGGSFYKVFLIFFSITAVALLGLLFYINYNLTKDKRLFY